MRKRLAICRGLSAAVVLSALVAVSLTHAEPAAPAGGLDPTSPEFFAQAVAPLLATHCLGCHNPSAKKSGLDLTRAESLATGGDSGPAVVPGDPESSLLWQRVAADEMPPDEAAGLNQADKDVLRRWITAGATWGPGPIDPLQFTTTRRAGYDWWSLKPIAAPPIPEVSDSQWQGSPLDAFVFARLESAGLRPSPPADRRTLICRLSFDLLGLPPSPEEVEAFVADERPEAFAQLVDRLLDSPHYGERWARHWLDVARFGESQGFERDKLRPNSWPYRDWVIAALNDDLPYDEFVRRQIAGDVLYPADPSAVIATGFLVAGPWDEVGQTQQSAAMKAVVRQDELEDLVGTTCQTFLGLTVHCARCHDHKFDPVFQVDYYRIAAALGGVRHGERASGQADLVGAEIQARRTAIEQRFTGLRDELAALESPFRELALARQAESAPQPVTPEPMARWDFDDDFADRIGSLQGAPHGSARLGDGRLHLDGVDAYVSTVPLDRPLRAKTLEAWVELDRLEQGGGGVMSVQMLDGQTFDAIVYGEREPRRWIAGSNGFGRTQDVDGPDETEADKQLVHMAVVYSSDGTITVYRNGRQYGQSYQATGPQPFEAGASQVVFGLRHAPVGGNRMLAGSIDRAQLYDRALSAAEVAASAGTVEPSVSDDELLSLLPTHLRTRREELVLAISRLEALSTLLASGPVYAVSPSTPEICHLLERGDPSQPADVVAPGGVAAVAPAKADFGLPADAADAERRTRLAEWITAPENPLTARVIANRLWHYHFGVGIVETPNDFGFNGGRPSHRELLDWLAAELVRGNWSLKQLHRTIVLSATYRQSSAFSEQAAKIDAGNRLLWRKSPLRLEAEVLRDAVLKVAGQLNPTMGGPGYHDFRTFTFNSQFYEVFDPEGYRFARRSIYRTWVRSGTNPLLDVLDCPDPSATTPARAVTTTPLQALALLNNSFMLRMADRFADRVCQEAGEAVDDQVTRAYELAYARPPRPDELAAARAFAGAHGLAAFCRVIFNSNEFLYVD